MNTGKSLREPASECKRPETVAKIYIPTGQFHSIGTILCAERWCCLSSLLGYWAQSWTGRHSDAGYSNGSIIPGSWYAFGQLQKDDRLSQPQLVCRAGFEHRTRGSQARPSICPSVCPDHTLCRALVLPKQSPGLLYRILDGSPLRHSILSSWYSFC